MRSKAPLCGRVTSAENLLQISVEQAACNSGSQQTGMLGVCGASVTAATRRGWVGRTWERSCSCDQSSSFLLALLLLLFLSFVCMSSLYVPNGAVLRIVELGGCSTLLLLSIVQSHTSLSFFLGLRRLVGGLPIWHRSRRKSTTTSSCKRRTDHQRRLDSDVDASSSFHSGGGTAGCVLAARLSFDPSISVLVIEGGPDDRTLPQVLQVSPSDFSC